MTKCIADCDQEALPTASVCEFHLNNPSDKKPRAVSRVDLLRGMKVGDSIFLNVTSEIAWQQYGTPGRRLNIKLSINNEGGGSRMWRTA